MSAFAPPVPPGLALVSPPLPPSAKTGVPAVAMTSRPATIQAAREGFHPACATGDELAAPSRFIDIPHRSNAAPVPVDAALLRTPLSRCHGERVLIGRWCRVRDLRIEYCRASVMLYGVLSSPNATVKQDDAPLMHRPGLNSWFI
jgi:hypothetical protein